MSIFKNLLNAFVPVRERRESAGTLVAANAEVVHDCNGDESALVYVSGGGATLNATLEFTGSVDGVNYFAVLAYPFSPGCLGGTVPVGSQPLLVEAVNVANAVRVYAVACGQLAKLRVRLSVWTAGVATVAINTEAQASIHPNVMAQKSGTLIVSATAAVGVAAVATLPAVAGLRHYIDFVQVRRSATAALTASATPVVTTSANLPGAVAMTFGQDAGGIGVDKDERLDFGASGMAATAAGTVSSITCPAYVGVVWRVNVAYRLGL